MDEDQKARIVDMTTAVLGVFNEYEADEDEALQALALVAGAVLKLVEGDDVEVPFKRFMSVIAKHISVAHGVSLRNDPCQLANADARQPRR